jgi:3'-phosphoadenosine 5'-phosphosulfate sulfotransferase
VASKKGVRVRGKVWSEIHDALEKVRPDIRSIIAFQNEALSITRTQKKLMTTILRRRSWVLNGRRKAKSMNKRWMRYI